MQGFVEQRLAGLLLGRIEAVGVQFQLQAGKGMRTASGRAIINAASFDKAVDPRQARDGVLGEVKALQPNHEGRLEAIERAEKARQRDLESRNDDEFKRELGTFVEEGKLKKSGGVEEVERLRKAKDERARKENAEREAARMRAKAEKRERDNAAAAAALAARREAEAAAAEAEEEAQEEEEGEEEGGEEGEEGEDEGAEGEDGEDGEIGEEGEEGEDGDGVEEDGEGGEEDGVETPAEAEADTGDSKEEEGGENPT